MALSIKGSHGACERCYTESDMMLLFSFPKKFPSKKSAFFASATSTTSNHRPHYKVK